MQEKTKKKKVGIFSLTCDEGCSIYLIEIFNKKLPQWLEKMELGYFLSLKDHMEIDKLDIALIEGVISTQKDLDQVKELREKTKVIIAMGSCAVSGMPSGQRNNFSPEQQKKIKPELEKFGFLPKCIPLKDAIEVDDNVNGCPIDEQQFIEVFEKHL